MFFIPSTAARTNAVALSGGCNWARHVTLYLRILTVPSMTRTRFHIAILHVRRCIRIRLSHLLARRTWILTVLCFAGGRNALRFLHLTILDVLPFGSAHARHSANGANVRHVACWQHGVTVTRTSRLLLFGRCAFKNVALLYSFV